LQERNFHHRLVRHPMLELQMAARRWRKRSVAGNGLAVCVAGCATPESTAVRSPIDLIGRKKTS
jgi:hypothetical protein